MVTQYAIGGQKGYLLSEHHAAEAVTGFFTRRWWCRFITINGLTKRQGRALLQELGADERLYLKMPTADLLDEKPGQADETELGITYASIR